MNASIAALLMILVLATLIDLREQRIPNWLSIGGIVLGFSWQQFLLGIGTNALLFSLEGAALALMLLMPAYMFKVLGAGDVKLMAAVGTFLGPELVLCAILATLIAGGFLAFLFMSLNSRGFDIARLRKLRFPYGGAILAGTTYALWFSGRLNVEGIPNHLVSIFT